MIEQHASTSTPVSVPRTNQSQRNMREGDLEPIPSLSASFGARRAAQLQETTPLLSRKISVSFDVPPQLPHRPSTATKHGEQEQLHFDFHSSHQRRVSNGSTVKSIKSTRSVRPVHVGRSTFGQTVCYPISCNPQPTQSAFASFLIPSLSYLALECYPSRWLSPIRAGLWGQ